MAARFLLIAYGTSWTVAAALWATGGIGGLRHVFGGFAFMLGPTVAALFVTPTERYRDVFALRPRFDRWLLLAWAMPCAAVVAATLGAALLPGVRLQSPAAAVAAMLAPDQAAKLAAVPPLLFSAGLVFQAFVWGPAINAPFMLSEELGWRGALWSAWSRLGFWRQALLTGAVWGLWHAPLISMGHNYPDAPVLGVGLMVVFCTLLAVPLHHVRDRGGTIWHACLFHGTINAGASLGSICVQTESWPGRGIVGVPGFVALGVCCAAVALARRRRS